MRGGASRRACRMKRCALAAKHGLKPSTLHGHRVNLAAALAELGDVEVQKLSKRHLDDLVTTLRAGGRPSPTGKTRKPWSPRSVNYMLGLLSAVLKNQMRQGRVVRNVADLVDRIPADPKPPNTFTPAELQKVLALASLRVADSCLPLIPLGTLSSRGTQ